MEIHLWEPRNPVKSCQYPIQRWPCHLMDKMSDFGSEDCRFESCHSCKGMSCFLRAYLVAQAVKNPPVIQEPQEMQVRSLGEEKPLEEEMATRSSILAWRISWTEEPGGLQFMGLQRVRHNWSDLACTPFEIQGQTHWREWEKVSLYLCPPCPTKQHCSVPREALICYFSHGGSENRVGAWLLQPGEMFPNKFTYLARPRSLRALAQLNNPGGATIREKSQRLIATTLWISKSSHRVFLTGSQTPPRTLPMNPMKLLTCHIPSWPVQSPAFHIYTIVHVSLHRWCACTPREGAYKPLQTAHKHQHWPPLCWVQGTNLDHFKAQP